MHHVRMTGRATASTFDMGWGYRCEECIGRSGRREERGVDAVHASVYHAWGYRYVRIVTDTDLGNGPERWVPTTERSYRRHEPTVVYNRRGSGTVCSCTFHHQTITKSRLSSIRPDRSGRIDPLGGTMAVLLPYRYPSHRPETVDVHRWWYESITPRIPSVDTSFGGSEYGVYISSCLLSQRGHTVEGYARISPVV